MIKTSYATWGTLIPMLFLTWYFSGMMDKYHAKQMRLQERVWQLEDECGYTEANKIAFTVTVTTYNPTVKQCDDTPNQTADGTYIKPWKATDYRYVALSRDLLSRWGGPFEYGDYVVIEGTEDGEWDGIYQVRDTMNAKWVKRVDILTTNSRFKYIDVKMYKYVNKEVNS